MEYKYISKDTLEYLSLHDCIIQSTKFEKDNLTLDFEHIDVLPSHPNNPYDVAKYTGKASLIFQNCEVLKSFIYDTRFIKKSVIQVEKDAQKVNIDIINLATDFEVLDMKMIEKNGISYVYEFGGNCSNELGSDFGVFILKFDMVLICWNELINDAWFVGFNKGNNV